MKKVEASDATPNDYFSDAVQVRDGSQICRWTSSCYSRRSCKARRWRRGFDSLASAPRS